MPKSGFLLDYSGQVDYNMIDTLLQKIKQTEEFIILNKTTGKRVYSILVECLENIAKHCARECKGEFKMYPKISVKKVDDKIVINSGNPVKNDKTGELIRRLNQVNYLDEKQLNTLYENKINKKVSLEENGAGLGFMLMKIKSGNKIVYNFTRIDSDHLYFELKISVNEYIMRKLIIDQTANSPKVILDPDKNIFEISGESRPPDVANFYDEILRWMDDYSVHLLKSNETKDPVTFNLDFDYFNSSSAKYILDFCKQIASVRSKGENVMVKWHYEDEDIDMLEVGREMSRMVKVPFEYVLKDIK